MDILAGNVTCNGDNSDSGDSSLGTIGTNLIPSPNTNTKTTNTIP